MGTDIHMSVEVRAVSGWNRSDATVRRLQRAASEGDADAKAELEAHEVREGPWELRAIETFGTLGGDAGFEIPTDRGDGWRGVCLPFPWTPPEEFKPPTGDWVATNLEDLPLPWWEYRDYEAFARLAGVRNYRAGVGNHQGVEPIDGPRGLPPGFVLPVGSDGRSFWLGEHSHSWLLASEILCSNLFGGTVGRQGFVCCDDYLAWVAGGRQGSPRSWSRSVSGRRVVTLADVVSEIEVLKALQAEGYHPHVFCEWEDERQWPVADMARAWADRFGAESVRFVFGFDS